MNKNNGFMFGEIVAAISIAALIFFSMVDYWRCVNQDSKKKINTLEYNAYIKKNGSNSRFFCQAGFLVKENIEPNEHTPTLDIITHDDNIPTRCNESGNTSIIVKETAKTGLLSGSVN